MKLKYITILIAAAEVFLRKHGLYSPGKVMYIGGSDTLPVPLCREEEGRLIDRLT